MIAVLIPVLNRPGSAQRVADSLAAASPNVRLVFIVSPGDHEQLKACYRTDADIIETTWEPGHGDFARKINLAFTLTTEPFVFQAADDVDFTAGWDDEALRVAEDTGAGVIGTNDQANPLVKAGKHSTHSLIRRSYVDMYGGTIDGPGLVFSEAYDHGFVDNELVELAKVRRQWAFAAKAVVRHRHWVWRTAEKDATYEKAGAQFREDSRLFAQRRRMWARTRAQV